jgi:hypothetical protein
MVIVFDIPINLAFISHKVFLKTFCRSQLPHKPVNLSFTITYIKNQLTNLWGSSVLQNDFKNTLCEISSPPQDAGGSAYLTECIP